MRGRAIPLSVPRRMVTDVMRFAATVPSFPFERVMDLRAVVAARDACAVRPPWAGILAKAYGLTAQEFPELRRTFVKWPWPHLYEYPSSIAGVTVERIYEGEPCVVLRLIRDPAARRISEIARLIHDAMEAPIDQFREYKRLVRFGRLPVLIRRPILWLGLNLAHSRAKYFGTFAISAVSFMGTDSLNLPTWVTTILTFGIIQRNGQVPVRIIVDHRVFDGVAVARILARLEAILNGPILEELRAQE